jgi:hypothetical protein
MLMGWSRQLDQVANTVIEADFGGPILDCPNDTQQHTAGNPAPGAMVYPRLAFEGLLAFDLTLAQRACGEAGALGCAPPARARRARPPEARRVCRRVALVGSRVHAPETAAQKAF